MTNNIATAGLQLLKADKLDGVFFDFDGVLADSVDIKAEAFLSLFVNESDTVKKAISAYFYRYTGRSRQEKLNVIFDVLLQRRPQPGEIARLCDLFTQRSLQSVIDCAEINGSRRLLRHLPGRIKKFVVSGTPETELQLIVQARSLEHHFTEVRGTPTRKEINIATLLQRHDLSAGRCLMIGDGDVDRQAAADNDMPFIGVVKAANTSPFDADTVTVEDLAELQRLLAL